MMKKTTLLYYIQVESSECKTVGQYQFQDTYLVLLQLSSIQENMVKNWCVFCWFAYFAEAAFLLKSVNGETNVWLK